MKSLLFALKSWLIFMKPYLLLTLVLLVAGCQPSSNANLEHLGCSSNETAADGTCIVASSGNSQIFDYLDGSKIVASDVEYATGVIGFLSQPKDSGSYPGVVMIHEWWGLNDNIKAMAKLLSQEGYVVLAVDLYGGNVAVTSEDAGKFAGQVRSNPQAAVDNMKSAVTYLKSLNSVQEQNIGSIGWCFGGGQSLELAVSGENMSATVIYYGSLTDDPSKLSRIRWPVLGIFGEQDTSTPVSSVKSFESELNKLGISSQIFIYDGVGHAFANPSGARYAPNETMDAWVKTVNFLNENLKK